MKRRDFIKKLPIVAGASFSLAGVPMQVFSKSGAWKLAEESTNDRVLIIIQMHGGNDGLNTLIPVEQYDLYYSRRANIAIPASNSIRKMIPLDSTLPSPDQVGLHPDMADMKAMYDQGQMAFVQGVSYLNNNGSHFRGRDIHFMGGGFDDYFSSGWVGRYLQHAFEPQQYPDDFPNPDMLDPLAIELGSDVSLIFHQEGNIPTSISLGSSPDSFASLVESLEGFFDEGIDPRGKPPTALENSIYGTELNWILNLEDKSEDYAQRLADVYGNSSPSSVTYPETYPFNAPQGSLRNPLSSQLQLIARLLDGGGAGLGVKTKVFLVKMGGFDTHADQVESFDPTMGAHAAKLYHLSSAMKAFQSDLRSRGLEDRVLAVTTSEFGRRIGSNGSFGTDHGTGGPVILFGSYANGGVYGTNPDVTLNNVAMQFDYRQVYTALLKDWFEVPASVIEEKIFFKNYLDGPKDEGGGSYEPLPIVADRITGTESFFSDRFYLGNCYPNPCKDQTSIPFRINSHGSVEISLTDLSGRRVKTIVNKRFTPGDHTVKADLNGLKPGVYLYSIKAGLLEKTKKLIKE